MGGAPEGFDAKLVLAEAEKAAGPVIHIARDDKRMAALREALGFFAPDMPVVSFPAWDCLPYDRVSPNPDISAARMAALAGLVFADDALNQAVGTDVRLAGHFATPQSGVLGLRGFTLRGAGYSADLDGRVSGLDSGFHMDGDVSLEARDLSRFAALAARTWSGSGEDDFADFLARLGPALERFEAISGYTFPELPYADPASQSANYAYRGPVTVSAGSHQPHFGPARLTNGIPDPFDHFLGFPTTPEPLEITVELLHPAFTPPTVGRVVVHERAVGSSYELYELFVSGDGGATWQSVGQTAEGTRGEAAFVEFRFDPRPVTHVRVVTHGCKNLTFPSFSRLSEIEAFAE